ncbi:MAG TPA: PIG-L deacetylase family protein [Ilumatobacteraceae bacterium]|jgi:LmbE family N-acetylglucosaminyl deacetylase
MTIQLLEPVPEDWTRALGIVAHPDDMEYGAASAVARWTAQGKDVRYVLVTRGEAGISTMHPDVVGPAREEEQRRSGRAVGVSVVEFLDHPDGLVQEDLALRRDLTAVIRRHQPEVILSTNHRDSWGGTSWNHADHRAVGRTLLDAVRDAANPWVFPGDGEPWSGVRFALFNGSPMPTHAVDVTGHLEKGIESLMCHELYLANLDGGDDPGAILRSAAQSAGAQFAVDYAVAFELVAF